ncbi:nodulin homeobox isoform X1 [Tanacetum coccineum]
MKPRVSRARSPKVAWMGLRLYIKYSILGHRSYPWEVYEMYPPPIDMISAVTELPTLSSQELSKLIRDAENDTIQYTTSNGSSKQINVESLARYLAWHLMATPFERRRDEEHYRYLLGGFRLLHGLCDLAPRNSVLEQVLLEDVKVSEQMFDLIFFNVAHLVRWRQDSQLVLLHSALLACILHLFTAFISSQWHELAPVLLAHPEVDEFMHTSFAAVRVDIQYLQVRLPGQYMNGGMQSNLAQVNRLCQHCEASLQFLQSLCQQRPFRERLVKNKDLCEKGGILSLAHEIMKLPFCEDSYLMAVVSRLKSKVLSILLNLCEVESTSFLDVAASTTVGLDLAKSTISQVISLLRTMFRGDLNGLAAYSDKTYPRGLLQLNAMRLTEILSDDSNFRSYITLNFTEVLTTIFSQPHGEFLSSWCSESRPSEEDATLDFDSLAAAGWVLGVVSSSDVPESTFNACRVPRTSYAFQRTSLLVKVVANLTCFIPDICKEEKDLFLNTFLHCFHKELLNVPYGVLNDVRAERAAVITQNLGSLLIHAASLTPEFLNQDDVQLFKLFIAQLEPLIAQESNIEPVIEADVKVQESPDAHDRDGDQNKGISIILPLEEVKTLTLNGNEGPSNGLQIHEQRTDAAQTYTVRAVHESEADAQNAETSGLDSNTMQSEDKLSRKRKRNIMNHIQISMIEQVLVTEPEMQRKAAMLQSWAEKLSLHVWYRNIFLAAKELNSLTPSPSPAQGTQRNREGGLVKHEQGQYVVLTDGQGEEIGKGRVHQASGVWSGTNLDESGSCVVDVTYLKLDKWAKLQQPCGATRTALPAVAQTKSHGPRLILFGGATAIEGGASAGILGGDARKQGTTVSREIRTTELQAMSTSTNSPGMRTTITRKLKSTLANISYSRRSPLDILDL